MTQQSDGGAHKRLVDELPRAVPEAGPARVLAMRAGFPSSLLPSFENALVFWTKVVAEADAGIFPGGVNALIQEAARQYPFNAVFTGNRDRGDFDDFKEFVDGLLDITQANTSAVELTQTLSDALKIARALKSEMGNETLMTKVTLLAKASKGADRSTPLKAKGSQRSQHPQRAEEEVRSKEALRQLLQAESSNIEELRRVREERRRTENTSVIVADQLVKLLESGFSLGPISLSLSRRDIVAVVGPNGSGKTTLLKCLAHETAPSSGSVVVTGARGRRATRRAKIGYIPQRLQPWGGTLQEHYQLTFAYHEIYGEENNRKLTAISHEFQISHLLDRKWHQLSGGERTLCALAEQVALDPAILVLDEPLAALDPWTAPSFLNQLRQESRIAEKAVIFSTQSIFDAESLATHVLVLKNGIDLFYGPPDSISDDYDTQVWQLELRVASAKAVEMLSRFFPDAIIQQHESARHIWLEFPKQIVSNAMFNALVEAGLHDNLLAVRNITCSAIRKFMDGCTTRIEEAE